MTGTMVLVLDDSASVREVLRFALESEGYRVLEAVDGREVSHFREHRISPDGVAVANSAFDVTPHRYIRAIITEAGVARPPYTANLVGLCKD